MSETSCGHNARAEKTIHYIGERKNVTLSPIYFLVKYILFSFFSLNGAVMTKESKFQSALIKELKKIFPGCMVLKNDSSYYQGIPDLLVLYSDKWAMLECKRSSKAHHQPNQDYYIEKFGKMSYASFISPENKEEVLNELQQTFQSGR